jgi:hypothetical protein
MVTTFTNCCSITKLYILSIQYVDVSYKFLKLNASSWNSLNTVALLVVMDYVLWGMIDVKHIKLDEG